MATLGQQLKEAREAKGVSESDAGRATKILTKLIHAMENDDFSDMAAPMYAKGFIRLYADYLGLDPDPLVDEYMQRHAPARRPLMEEPPNRFARNAPSGESNTNGSSRFAVRIDWRSALDATRRFLQNRLPSRRRAQSSPPAAPSAETKKPGGPLRDIRVIAVMVAGLIVLLVLISALSTCTRRRAAREPAAPAPPPKETRNLLEEPLPDLYLVEPGKIERNEGRL